MNGQQKGEQYTMHSVSGGIGTSKTKRRRLSSSKKEAAKYKVGSSKIHVEDDPGGEKKNVEVVVGDDDDDDQCDLKEITKEETCRYLKELKLFFS